MEGYRIYYIGEKRKATIVIVNDMIEGLFIRELSDEHHVCVKIIVKDKETYIVNSYFQYSDEIEEHIRKWDRIKRNLEGKRLILAGDVNAKSVLWFNRNTDSRGEELEAFIAANNLDICNREGEISTFAGVPGAIAETNIDVTLKTGMWK